MMCKAFWGLGSHRPLSFPWLFTIAMPWFLMICAVKKLMAQLGLFPIE